MTDTTEQAAWLVERYWNGMLLYWTGRPMKTRSRDELAFLMLRATDIAQFRRDLNDAEELARAQACETQNEDGPKQDRPPEDV